MHFKYKARRLLLTPSKKLSYNNQIILSSTYCKLLFFSTSFKIINIKNCKNL